MSLIDLVVLFVIGLRPEWRLEACDGYSGRMEICQKVQEDGYAAAQLLAPIFVQEGERSGLSPFYLASVAAKENSLNTGDLCIVNMPRTRIVSTEELTPRVEGERRIRMCIHYSGDRLSCRTGIVLDETDERIKINYCAAGEIGLFQLTPHEARAGMVVPATGEELPRSYRDRRERLLDPVVNTSLAARALAICMEKCCGDDQGCRDTWPDWVGSYNVGICGGAQFYLYGSRIEQNHRQGMEYLCSQAPDAEVCLEETMEVQ